MKVTAEQIQQLYHFTEQHFVQFYDLQTELVDHLANSIEAHWRVNQNTNFDDVLLLEFKKFGVFGFQDIIEKQRDALRKSYNLIVWNNFKNFFSLPKLIGTILSIAILFQILLKVSFAENLLLAIYLVLIIIIILKLFVDKKNAKSKFKQTTKKYMFDDCIQNYGYTGVLSIFGSVIPQAMTHSNFFLTLQPPWLLLFCFMLVSLTIFFYIILFQIPQKREHYLLKKYPNLKFTSNL